MRHAWLHILFTCLMSATASSAAFAQTEIAVAERIRLRELLRVSATTEFSQKPNAALPAPSATQSAIKQGAYEVFLGFGLDFTTRNNFVRWLDEWNSTQSALFPKLVITENIQQADIILTRFPGEETVIDTTNEYQVKTEGNVYDKNNTSREIFVAMISYVLLPIKAAPLHLQALWRKEVKTKLKINGKQTIENDKNPGWQLRDALFALCKQKQPKN